jgi:hypothetical protein
VVALAGCATVADPYTTAPASVQLKRGASIGRCLQALQAIDARVDAAALRDAQAVRVPGYPYLRADRYSVRRALPEQNWRAPANAQVDRMALLDAEARAYELGNLGASTAERAEVERCRSELVASTRSDPSAPAMAAQVPDDYNDNLRVLGLYPLTRIPFAGGISGYQESVRTTFGTSFPELKVEGRRLRYLPTDGRAPDSIAGLLPSATRSGSDALGTPALEPSRAWQLLQANAPIIVVDTASEDDRIGSLQWQQRSGAPIVGVNPEPSVAYVRVAWTEVANQVVPQLVYSFWFPARRARNLVDIEAGHLDGVVWRVTLGGDGRPLVYDSIHSCGCFQMFFPTERVRERPPPAPDQGPFDEGMFAPQNIRAPGPGERVVVYLSSPSHQIQRVAVENPPFASGLAYHLVDENVLRALPLPAVAGGARTTQSVYGPDGRVAGTERAERWVYWPMGIESPGQMRQWGRHATAFVGRRHFDDPLLIDRYFTLAPRGEPH